MDRFIWTGYHFSPPGHDRSTSSFIVKCHTTIFPSSPGTPPFPLYCNYAPHLQIKQLRQPLNSILHKMAPHIPVRLKHQLLHIPLGAHLLQGGQSPRTGMSHRSEAACKLSNMNQSLKSIVHTICTYAKTTLSLCTSQLSIKLPNLFRLTYFVSLGMQHIIKLSNFICTKVTFL